MRRNDHRAGDDTHDITALPLAAVAVGASERRYNKFLDSES